MGGLKVRMTAASAVGGLLLLAGCAPLEQQFPILSLVSNSSPRPPALNLRPEIIPTLPHYRPVRLCRYSSRMAAGFGSSQQDTLTITVRRVRDRLLVTSVSGADQSTALISSLGQRYDFNAADASGGRLTPKSFAGTEGERGPQMNNIDLFIPPYGPGPASPGQTVSSLRDSGGAVRAVFVYRGVTTFHDRPALLMDLMISSGGTTGRTVGFSIVDRERGLPLLFAAAGRPSIRAEQVDCQD